MFVRGFKTWCENVAAQQRRELGVQPVDPLDTFSLAKKLGFLAWTPEQIPDFDSASLTRLLVDDPNSWSAVTLTGGGQELIILNSSHSGGRPASNLAHELSHVLLAHQPARIDVSEDGLLMLTTYDRKQEAEAKWLAGCLLLPRAALVRIRAAKMAEAVAASSYGVSLDMLKYRLNVTGVDYQFGKGKRRK